jgi:hypothetical protein
MAPKDQLTITFLSKSRISPLNAISDPSGEDMMVVRLIVVRKELGIKDNIETSA